jgi:hypothetical protein
MSLLVNLTLQVLDGIMVEMSDGSSLELRTNGFVLSAPFAGYHLDIAILN